MSINVIDILFELLNVMLGYSTVSLLALFFVTILVVGKERSSQLFERILESK
jgi:predicted permease